VRALPVSLHEIRTVLSSKRPSASSHGDLRELWLQHRQLEHQRRMVDDLHAIREAPAKLETLVSQKRFLAAVSTLNKTLAGIFSEDLMDVEALVGTRDVLVQLKSKLIDALIVG